MVGIAYWVCKVVEVVMDVEAFDARRVAVGDLSRRVDRQNALVVAIAVLELIGTKVQREELPLVSCYLVEDVAEELLVGPRAWRGAPGQAFVG